MADDSKTWLQSSNNLMQTLKSIKSLILETVTEQDIPNELEKDDSYIPVRIRPFQLSPV